MVRCFNPWLEARFPGGLGSNCITCHQRAVIGAADYLPVTHGELHPDDVYFRGVATDLLGRRASQNVSRNPSCAEVGA
ncbi:MAG: hypothetical protein ABI467_31330 [Kofleriaceae bacterium]